jgi:hypothetical protein
LPAAIVIATLVAATLNVDLKALPHQASDKARTAMTKAIRAGLYGSLSASGVAQLGPKIFPFHPTVLPVIVRAIRKFGQNERSLFSFISAFEPMGLQQILQLHSSQIKFYRVNHFFEYVRQNLLPSIRTGNSNIHCCIIDSVLSSRVIASPEEESVFKSVALLTLLDSPGLPATERFLKLALDNGSNETAISHAIGELKKHGLMGAAPQTRQCIAFAAALVATKRAG